MKVNEQINLPTTATYRDSTYGNVVLSGQSDYFVDFLDYIHRGGRTWDVGDGVGGITGWLEGFCSDDTNDWKVFIQMM